MEYKQTKNPYTEEFEEAIWIADYFGKDKYGVQFKDGVIYNPQLIKLETKQEQFYTN